MFLTWVNIIELNNLGWNKAVPLFCLRTAFISELKSLFLGILGHEFFFCVLSAAVYLWRTGALIKASDKHETMTGAAELLRRRFNLKNKRRRISVELFIANRIKTQAVYLFIYCPSSCRPGSWVHDCFPRLLREDLGLKEKRRNERKETSKLASCHRAPVWSPFAFLRAIRQQAVIKRGYVFERSPVPRDECPSLSRCNHFLCARKPQTKACLFLRTGVSAEKRNTTHIYEIIWHLVFHYYERKSCFMSFRVETCDTRKRFGAVTLLSRRRRRSGGL